MTLSHFQKSFEFCSNSKMKLSFPERYRRQYSNMIFVTLSLSLSLSLSFLKKATLQLPHYTVRNLESNFESEIINK